MTSSDVATATVVHSFCRICTGGCGVELTLDETGHIERIVGDRGNTPSQGYACFKGLQSPGAHRAEKRLLHPLKRLPDGSYQEISLEQALDEIGARLAELIAVRGPEAIASFCGNGAILNSTAVPKAANEFHAKTVRPNQTWQTDFASRPFGSPSRLVVDCKGGRACEDRARLALATGRAGGRRNRNAQHFGGAVR